jgi:hypothetical protein
VYQKNTSEGHIMTPAEQQARADYWDGVTPRDAFRAGVKDRCHWITDTSFEAETPPQGTEQRGEYERGWQLRSSSSGQSPAPIIDEVMADA